MKALYFSSPPNKTGGNARHMMLRIHRFILFRSWILALCLFLLGAGQIHAQNTPCEAIPYAFAKTDGSDVVPCGPSANTSSSVDIILSPPQGNSTYVLNGGCGSPSTTSTNVLWTTFVLPAANAGFEWQAVGGPDDYVYEMYYSNDSGGANECTDLMFVECGESFTGWKTPTLPDAFNLRIYIAYYLKADMDGTMAGTVNLKARKSCGEAAACAIAVTGTPVLECLADGSYTVTFTIEGTDGEVRNGNFEITDANATSISPSVVALNEETGVIISTAEIVATYPAGVDYSIDIIHENSSECATNLFGDAEVCCSTPTLSCPPAASISSCDPDPTDEPTLTVPEGAIMCPGYSISEAEITGSIPGCGEGGSYTKTWTLLYDADGDGGDAAAPVADDDGNAITCSQVVTETANLLEVSCPAEPVSLDACATMEDIADAYSAWVSEFEVMGGCNTSSNIGDIPSLPDFTCGDEIDLSFTLTATDDCNQGDDAMSCSSTFYVAAGTPLSVSCPAEPVSLDACATMEDIADAYIAWVSEFEVMGGCNTSSNIGEIPDLPDFTCGGEIDLSFTLTATDDCNQGDDAMSCSSTFYVAAGTPLSVSCPAEPVSLDACATMEDIADAYSAWVSEFDVMGGCNTSSNIGDIPDLPDFTCGDEIDLSFTLTATDDCNQGDNAMSCSSTFYVAAGTPLSVSCPAEPVSLDACATMEDIVDAYSAWVSEFEVMGGCNTSSNIGDIPDLPDFTCGDEIDLSFTLTATDDCNQGEAAMSCSSTFYVAAGTPLSVSCPAEPVSLDACATMEDIADAYSAWVSEFEVMGGCNTSSNIGDIPDLPDFTCGDEIDLSFTLTATDDCNQGEAAMSCSSTFYVAAGIPLSVSCPAEPVSLDACATMEDIADAYSAWVSEFEVMGGCNTSSNIGDMPALPGFACGDGFELSFTLTATDDCNNGEAAKSCSSTFKIAEADPLMLTAAPDDVTTNACEDPTDKFATWIAALNDMTASGGCDAKVVFDRNLDDLMVDGYCGEEDQVITVKIYAMDLCGETDPVTSTFTVTVDNEGPVFDPSTPTEVIVECSEEQPDLEKPNVTDNCDGEIDLTCTTMSGVGAMPDKCIQLAVGTTKEFDFEVTGLAPGTSIESLTLMFESNKGKGSAKFILVSPCGEELVLTGPPCENGAGCDQGGSFNPTFVSSGASRYDHNDVLGEAPNSGEFLPYGGDLADLACDNPNGTWTVKFNKSAAPAGSVRFCGVNLGMDFCGNTGVTTKYWVAEDACGNKSNFTQTIKVVDTTDPEFTIVPGNDTFECGTAPQFGTPTAEDACGDVQITFMDNNLQADECGLVPIRRTWTATDDCGNKATASQTLTPVDTTAPVLEIPKDVVFECSMGDSGEATATDECDNDVKVTFEDDEDLDACGLGTIIRTWTATDCSGQSVSKDQKITIQDSNPPVLEIPKDIVFECKNGNAGTATAVDTCDPDPTVTFLDDPDLDACGLGVIYRVWTARDCTGNSVSETQIITIKDSKVPEIDVPKDIVFECELGDPGTATATDICDGEVDVTYKDEKDLDECGFGVITRTWTAEDCAGNKASEKQTITIQDSNAPDLEIPNDITFECLMGDPGKATATDECDSDPNVSFKDEKDLDECGYGVIIRTWTAEDCAGNSVSKEQEIVIEDSEGPELKVPADVTFECSMGDSGEATATDNCDEEPKLSYEDEKDLDECGFGVIIRTWTAEDCAGNKTIEKQEITIEDNDAPELKVPSDVTFECSMGDAGEATATDNCDGDVKISYDDDKDLDECGYGLIIRTWTAEDCAGNKTSKKQEITIEDNDAPELKVPSDVTFECSMGDAGEATATDNCDGDVKISYDDDKDLDECGYGLIIRTWTAEDCAGNKTSKKQEITIEDNDAPELKIPSDVTFECSMGNAGEATATDNCDSDVKISYDDDKDLDECGYGLIIRTWTAEDCAGNSVSKKQEITIRDSKAPELYVPKDVTFECEMGDAGQATVSDYCDDAPSLSYSDETDSNGCSQVITRTWTAADCAGNTVSKKQTITIEDTTDPTINSCPSDISLYNDAGICGAVVIWVAPSVSDNCDPNVSISQTRGPVSGSIFEVGTTKVEYTAVDECGNKSTCSFEVKVKLKNDLEVVLTAEDASCNTAYDGSATVSVTGGVGPYSYEWSNGETTSTVSGLSGGMYKVTVSDACGNDEAEVVMVGSSSLDIVWNDIVLNDVSKFDQVCEVYNGRSHALKLVTNSFSKDYIFGSELGVMNQYSDGTASITGTVFEKQNPGNGWQFTILFEDRKDWEEWSAMGGGYRDGSGSGDHTQWSYYAMASSGSMLIGIGGHEGQALYLTPMDEHYRFQLGDGANNKNEIYGLFGRFDVSGDASGFGAITYGLDCEVIPSKACSAEVSLDCNGGYTDLDLTIEGGSGDYSYTWSTGQTTQDLTSISTGEYAITVTDNASGCSAEAKVCVIEPSAIQITEAVVVNASVHGYTDGGIDITVEGGSGDYTYMWSNGATTQDLAGLAAGTYSGTITDSNGCSISASVEVTQPDPNEAPSGEDKGVMTVANQEVSGSLVTNVSDPNGDEILVNMQPVVVPVHGTLEILQDGTFAYTPNLNFVGDDSFTYAVCDTGIPQMCTEVTITLRVESENSGIEVLSTELQIDEDMVLTRNMLDLVKDPDGDALKFFLSKNASNGNIELSDQGMLYYTPSRDYYGVDQFDLEICDNGNPPMCITERVMINVRPVNDVPKVEPMSVTTDEDIEISANMLTTALDLEGDQLTLSAVVSEPANGSVQLLDNGDYVYLPKEDFYGKDQFELQVCDDGSHSNEVASVCTSAIVNVQVLAVNDAPLAEPDFAKVVQGESIEIDVLSNDRDPESHLFGLMELMGTVIDGSVQIRDGKVFYTATEFFMGMVSVDYRIEDEHGAISYGKLDIEVVEKTYDFTEISVYPNPFSGGLLNMKVNGDFKKVYDVQLYDQRGKMLFNQQIDLTNSRYPSITLDLTSKGLSAGSYIVKIVSGDEMNVTKQVVKMN